MQERHGNSISSTKKFFMGSIVSANARNPRIRCNFSRRIGSQKRNLRFSELNLGICKPYTWKIVYHHIMNVVCKIWHYIRFFIDCEMEEARLLYYPKLYWNSPKADYFRISRSNIINWHVLRNYCAFLACKGGSGLLHISKNVQK